MDAARLLNCLSPDATWKEASSLLERASAELEVGEMVHGENFNLMEAMSAFEIMDPKVDVKLSKDQMSSVDDLISKGFAPVDISIQQVLDIMDHLLACEATWHNGFSLSQTVYTCIYLLKIDTTNSNLLLSSYCKSVSSICSSIRNFVCKSNAYEEEDFVVQSFGLPLEMNPAQKFLSNLNFLEEEISKKKRFFKSSVSKIAGKESLIQNEFEILDGVYSCLLNRIKFRKMYLQIILNFEKKEGRGLEAASKHIDEIFPLLSQLRASKEFLSSLSDNASLNFDAMNIPRDALSSLSISSSPSSSSLSPSATSITSTATAISPPSAQSVVENINGDQRRLEKQDGLLSTTASTNHALGFHAEVNRKFFAPVPHRKIKIYSWFESLEYFEKLFKQLQTICSLPLTSSLEVIFNFVIDFHKTNPLPVSRSILQVVLLQGENIFGKESVVALLSKFFDLPIISGPNGGSLAEKDPFLQPFFKKAGLAMVNVLKCLCQNSCRQRRNLNKMFIHFANILSDAEKTFQSEALKKFVSENFSKSWWSENLFLSWTVEQCCRVVLHFLLLGFRNELYAQCEYTYIYWYLDHVISTLLHNQAAREKNFFERKHINSSNLVASGNAKKGKKKSSSKNSVLQYQSSTEVHYFNCYMHFCKAYFRLLLALRADTKLIDNETTFNSLRERYNQRFESLKCLHIPEPLPYSFFVRSTKVDPSSTSDLYASSQEYFRMAASYCTAFASAVKRNSQGEAIGSGAFSGFSLDTRLVEIQNLQKIASRNELACRVAEGAGPGKNLTVSFDFSLHYAFPIATLKRSNSP